MAIKITNDDLAEIKKHGEKDYPHECCGFLLGIREKDIKIVRKFRAVENSRGTEDRHNRYLITPKDYLKAEQEALKEDLEIIGFYHSHPDVAARPSQYDLDYSWPVYSYLIVSVKNHKAEDARCWQIEDDRSAFFEENLIISDVSLQETEKIF